MIRSVEEKVTPPFDSFTPLSVSYPRSGCVWLNAMFELYFGRIRGPRNHNGEQDGISWVAQKKGEKYMWYHLHDKKLDHKKSQAPEGDIFLFRNPTDCIYSLRRIESKGAFDIPIQATLYRNLFEKWIDSKTILIYEKAVTDPYKCLKIVSNHFDTPYSQEKATIAVETCTKKNIMTKLNSRYHNSSVLAEDYQAAREKFRTEYNEQIKNIVVTDVTEPWLKKINFV